MQAGRHCALPGYDRRNWTGERLLRIHMGAPPRYDLEVQANDWAAPNEDIENEGCPGAWYRTPFIESLLRYRRTACGDGGRVPNRLLDLCDDELVIEAINILEAHEDAWRGEAMAQRMRTDSEV